MNWKHKKTNHNTQYIFYLYKDLLIIELIFFNINFCKAFNTLINKYFFYAILWQSLQ